MPKTNSQNLTPTIIKNLQCPAGKQKTYFWDSHQRGLGVMVRSSGRKSFVAHLRFLNGNETIIKLETPIDGLDTYGLKRARAEAKAKQVQAQNIVSKLQDSQKKEAQNITLKEAWDTFIKEKSLPTLEKRLSQRTLTDYAYAWKHFGCIQNLPVKKITPAIIRQLFLELGNVGKKAQANKSMRYLRAVLNYANGDDRNDEPLFKTNPVTQALKRTGFYKVERRQSVLLPSDFKFFLDTLKSLSDTDSDYLTLLLFTGLRATAALSLSWDDVDFKNRTLSALEKGNKKHVLPLPDYLYKTLLSRRNRYPEDIYMFSSLRSEKGHLMASDNIIARLNQHSGLNLMCHDLRRTFASCCNDIGLGDYQIKKLMNHSSKGDVTLGYIISNASQLKPLMQKVENHILQTAGRLPASDDAIKTLSERLAILEQENAKLKATLIAHTAQR